MKRWKYKQADRLRAAPDLIAKYQGNSIVRGYMRWFRVDRLCAIRELPLCGVELTEAQRQFPRTTDKLGDDDFRADWDAGFAFIAGRTSGGAPYGVTYEDMAQSDLRCQPMDEARTWPSQEEMAVLHGVAELAGSTLIPVDPDQT